METPPDRRGARSLLSGMALALCGTLSWGMPGHASVERSGSGQPNIIYIYADDLGFGELGAYGQARIQTPRIDQLAEEGMRFTDHYSGSSVCAPSRAALMTGRHMGRCYIRNNRPAVPWDEWPTPTRGYETRPYGEWPLEKEETTVGELLQEAGYQTAAVGKWGLGPPASEGHPNRQGFGLFLGYLCQRQAHNYYPTHLWRNDHKVDLTPYNGKIPRQGDGFLRPQPIDEWPADPKAFFEQFNGDAYAPDLMIREALRFIRANRDEPFFLYYATPVPHLALQVPNDSLQRYLGLGWDKDPYMGDDGPGTPYLPHPAPRSAYAAMITRMDRNVGRIVDLVEELGLTEDTIIMVSSDNGATGKDQVDTDFFDSHAGLRGSKGTFYEAGIRVPMIARWPGRIAAGSETDLVSYQPDFLPTALALAGCEELIPEDINGTSLAPTLLGNPGQQEEHDYLYWERARGHGSQAVRRGDWKAIRRGLGDGRMRVELYNLAADRRETQDLSNEHPEIVEEMEQIMDEARVPSELFPLPMLDE